MITVNLQIKNDIYPSNHYIQNGTWNNNVADNTSSIMMYNNEINFVYSHKFK